MKILIVEDDPKGARILLKGLEEEGFAVDVAVTGREAEQALASIRYDLVVLDWRLPDKQGIDICRDLRARDASIPILMLTARDALSDRVAGLNSGADDYVTKPYAFWELFARIRALLRRSQHAHPPPLTVGDLVIDQITHEVTRRGVAVDLTAKEYIILNALAQHQGQVLSRDQLVALVGFEGADNASNLLDVHVSHLRKKLDDESSPSRIRTVRGRGYCLGGVPV